MSTKRLASCCALLGVVLTAQAQAQDYTLNFNHVLGPGEPFHAGFLSWAERVAERTDGGLTIQVFHSAQLGVEEDIIEQIRQGANIGQNTDAARLGNYVPGIAVVNGPYFVEDREEAFALADSPTMNQWMEELATEHGIRVVCFDWVQSHRHFFTNEPVRSPEDLDGLRIRTPPAPIWQESIRALGATPVALNFGDVYSGLQQRAIDGAELVHPNITAAQPQRGPGLRQRDRAHPAGQLPGRQRRVVRRPAGRLPDRPRRGVPGCGPGDVRGGPAGRRGGQGSPAGTRHDHGR